MSSPASLPFTVAPIECPHCHTKQSVHVLARGGFAQIGEQEVTCAKCAKNFSVMVMDRIVAGPFLS
jgi:hypothetical protein